MINTLQSKGYDDETIKNASSYFRDFLIGVNISDFVVEFALNPIVGKIVKGFKFSEKVVNGKLTSLISEVDAQELNTKLITDMLIVATDVFDQSLNPYSIDESKIQVANSILNEIDENSTPIFLTNYDSVVIASEVIKKLKETNIDSQASKCAGILAAGNILAKEQLPFNEEGKLLRFKLVDYDSDKVKNRIKMIFPSVNYLTDSLNLKNQGYYDLFADYHLDPISYDIIDNSSVISPPPIIGNTSPLINYFRALSNLTKDILSPRVHRINISDVDASSLRNPTAFVKFDLVNSDPNIIESIEIDTNGDGIVDCREVNCPSRVPLASPFSDTSINTITEPKMSVSFIIDGKVIANSLKVFNFSNIKSSESYEGNGYEQRKNAIIYWKTR